MAFEVTDNPKILKYVIVEIETQWRELGENLGLKAKQLDSIGQNAETNKAKASKMLNLWVESAADISLNVLIAAIIEVPSMVLARYLKKTFAGDSSSAPAADGGSSTAPATGGGSSKGQEDKPKASDKVTDDILLIITNLLGSDWKTLGQQLKIPGQQLNPIKINEPDERQRGVKVLEYWTYSQRSPSLSVLKQALEVIPRFDIVNKIEEHLGN